MKRILVWDWPTRIFHWLFAGSFLVAFGVATTVDDDLSLFSLHMGAGLLLVLLSAWRAIWGLVGSAPSRFAALALHPSDLLAYLGHVVRGGRGRAWTGHNPAASWVTVVLLTCAVGLGLTGWMLSRGLEVVEEVHEALAWAMAGTVAVHLAGLVVHTLREREGIALSMVDGRRLGPAEVGLASSRPLAGLLLVALVVGWTGRLASSYDPVSREVTLPGLGLAVRLAEGEEAPGGSGAGAEGDEDEDEDD